MKTTNLKIGRRGELLAKRYLEDKGYTIVEQNFRNRFAEIDLIARKNGKLVFVEVRTKRQERFGTPEESINRNKINKLIRNAQAYVAYKRYVQEYRIDAVCVVLNETGQVKRIDHYECIW